MIFGFTPSIWVYGFVRVTIPIPLQFSWFYETCMCLGFIIIFPSNDKKIQWPTSRFENVAIFAILSQDSTGTHFVHTCACLTNQV